MDAIAKLKALRAELNTALQLQDLAAQDGTIEDWMVARKVSGAASDRVCAEVKRLTTAGFGGDLVLEIAVLGRLQRHHTDSRSVKYADLAVRV